MEEDTIAAIATPAGQGALGIIRISGPKAILLPLKATAPFPPSPAFNLTVTLSINIGLERI